MFGNGIWFDSEGNQPSFEKTLPQPARLIQRPNQTQITLRPPMSSPLVSVVIPTYNRAYCLPRTIDSALAQSHQNLELVVVDDGSRDETREMLSARYGHEPRVRYIYQENTGVSGARNRAMAESRGEFIALLDSDDVWFPWKIESQLAVLRTFPEAGMVWTDMEAINPDGHVFNRRYLRTMYSAWRWFTNDDLFDKSICLSDVTPELPPPIRNGIAYCGDIYSQMIMGSLVHTSTVLLRRERMLHAGQFQVEYRAAEDYPFHLKTCRLGPVAFLDLPAIQYQRGMADRLTAVNSECPFGTRFLETISRELATHRDRIRLPKWMIREVLAEAHAWIGESMLDDGDHSLARRHLAMSLWNKPWQPRMWQLLVLATLPTTIGKSLRGAYRSLMTPAAKQSPESNREKVCV